MSQSKFAARVLAALVSLSLLGGCASTKENNHDPYEKVNRKFYAFNDTLDKHILEPVAKKYAEYTPDTIRTSITNFFDNVGYLNTIANDLLQAKFKQGFQDSSRFVLNSTFGVGGLFDPAAGLGLVKHKEDLGQTLGVWGEDDYQSVMGGLTYYFGPAVSLKDRHRRYDPDSALFGLFQTVRQEQARLCSYYGMSC